MKKGRGKEGGKEGKGKKGWKGGIDSPPSQNPGYTADTTEFIC